MPFLMAASSPPPVAVAAIRIVLPAHANPVEINIAKVFARQVNRRCPAVVSTSGDAPLRVEFTVNRKQGKECYQIADAKNGGIKITGGDDLGLLYGVGKFLRTSHFDLSGFTPGSWRGYSRPKGTFRAMYAATHFANYYEAAPPNEVAEYVEDVALWGANTLIVTFPGWQFNGFDDPAATKLLEQLHRLMKAARGVGMAVGLVQSPNQAFTSAPKELRAVPVPDELGRHGNFGVNICPSMPCGREYLLKYHSDLFGKFADVGLDCLVLWPYDEGGCGCDRCKPWGATAYPLLSKEIVGLARKRWPKIRTVLSTWTYDTPPCGEWDGLTQFVAKNKTAFNLVMADAHEDFPRYPMEKGVPGNLPLVNFPEISMWGRSPWGGFGANPLPRRIQRLWNQTQGKLSGGMPYSEGIYEDINKAICFQLYWQPDRPALDILREYMAFEYSPDAADDLTHMAQLLEETWEKPGEGSLEANAIAERVQSELTPQVRSSWRWRILYLRTVIDSETYRRGGKRTGSVLKAAFDELTRIYHAEHAHSMPVHPPVVEE